MAKLPSLRVLCLSTRLPSASSLTFSGYQPSSCYSGIPLTIVQHHILIVNISLVAYQHLLLSSRYPPDCCARISLIHAFQLQRLLTNDDQGHEPLLSLKIPLIQNSIIIPFVIVLRNYEYLEWTDWTERVIPYPEYDHENLR